jgi:hypothetical protein
MKNIFLLFTLVMGLSITTISAQSLSSIASSAASNDLVKDLMKGAQVDEKQATGGAGALFGMAKENMSAEDFKGVIDAVPNMDKMLDAVPAVGGGSSSMLASTATVLTGMPKVKAAFNKMGISDDKIALFTPILVNYVEKNGSKILGEKLGKSLKP